MPTPEPNAELFADAADASLSRLISLLRRELDELEAVLPAAQAAQWSASPVPKPRDDTTQRASGGHGDPTQAVTLDDRRLNLRGQVAESTYYVRDAVIRVRGVRRGLELALSAWEGE